MSDKPTRRKDYDETRQPDGRFGKWNPGGGRAKRQVEAEYAAAFWGAITPEALAGIAKVLAARAMSGDVQAAKLLYEYAIGKPSQTLNVTTTPDEISLTWADDNPALDTGEGSE